MISTKSTCPEPGIYRNVPAEEYHAWDAMSNSRLGSLEDLSPKHFKWKLDHPTEPTKAMEVGSALHMLAVQPFEFQDHYVVAPECDRRTTVGKTAWAEFEKAAAGRIVLAQVEYERMACMAKALMAHKIAKALITDGEAEVSIVWIDAETGVRCKARMDYLLPPMIGDIKTTRSGDEREFSRSIHKYGYHRQSAFYMDGAMACGLDIQSFAFATVESDAPYDVSVYAPDDLTILAGRKSYKRGLITYKNCVETNTWPGRHETEVATISLPHYALADEGMIEGEMQ